MTQSLTTSFIHSFWTRALQPLDISSLIVLMLAFLGGGLPFLLAPGSLTSGNFSCRFGIEEIPVVLHGMS